MKIHHFQSAVEVRKKIFRKNPLGNLLDLIMLLLIKKISSQKLFICLAANGNTHDTLTMKNHENTPFSKCRRKSKKVFRKNPLGNFLDLILLLQIKKVSSEKLLICLAANGNTHDTQKTMKKS